MVVKTQEEKQADKFRAIEEARWIVGGDYAILDTETTGLHNAQICQIAILHSDGREFKSLIKPTVPIEPGAEAVHHITNDDVKDAPTAEIILSQIDTSKPLVIYNAKFDVGVLLHSLAVIGKSITLPEIADAMLIYASFKGDWFEYYGNYKWQKLGVACEQCGIVMDDDSYHEGFHDAMYDAKMTDKLLKYIANQELPTE